MKITKIHLQLHFHAVKGHGRSHSRSSTFCHFRQQISLNGLYKDKAYLYSAANIKERGLANSNSNLFAIRRLRRSMRRTRPPAISKVSMIPGVGCPTFLRHSSDKPKGLSSSLHSLSKLSLSVTLRMSYANFSDVGDNVASSARIASSPAMRLEWRASNKHTRMNNLAFMIKTFINWNNQTDNSH